VKKKKEEKRELSMTTKEWIRKWLPEFLLIISLVVFIVAALVLESSPYSYKHFLDKLQYAQISDLVNLIVTTDGFVIAFTGVIATIMITHLLEKEGKMYVPETKTTYKKMRSQTVNFLLLTLIPLIVSIYCGFGVIITQDYYPYSLFSIISLLIGLEELVGLISFTLIAD
jgi:magnesium-transporting ATPase (P-type)